MQIEKYILIQNLFSSDYKQLFTVAKILQNFAKKLFAFVNKKQ